MKQQWSILHFIIMYIIDSQPTYQGEQELLFYVTI